MQACFCAAVSRDLTAEIFVLALLLQERKLVEALFACYGPDHKTICRLLCCPHAAEEVQDLVAEAQADIRCEVCRNPEVRSPSLIVIVSTSIGHSSDFHLHLQGEELMILCDQCDKGYHIFCL